MVVHAREMGVHEFADRLRDRLRSQVERIAPGARTVRGPSGPADGGRTALARGGPVPLQ
ncbi:hypothetical protein GCM10019016_020620 [Streptomyces prasinosporus]|uniref:Uncharacterized protein n=2 Tax=Streptomyces prasinosporus TaxID=68256 RepID=A0ABP6TI93_9ACTN